MSDDDVYSSDEFSEFDDTDADEDYFPEGIEHLQNNSESEASLTDEVATISRQQIQPDQVSSPDVSLNIQQTNQNVAIWGTINTTINYSNFTYNSTRETVGINPDIYETMYGGSPWEFLSLFLDTEVFNLIVTETNRYAGQLLSTPLRRHSRLNAWKETNAAEIKRFLGIIMWMGLEHLPIIQNYWAKKGIYSSKISKYMKVKRFELLLRTFHVSNNHECPPGDRLFKVRGLVDLLVSKYKHTMIETINKRGQTTKKPEIVIDYNKGKALVDICDQRSSYHSPLRKSMKWYRKVAIEIILSTSVLNAMCLYNKVNKTKIGITEFKEMLVKDMCGDYEETDKEEVEHKLSKSGKRTRCVKCYDEMAKQGGRKHAQRITKQSNYWCAACQKVYCIECFFDDHKVQAKKT
ncbi:hypothetical protein ACI65C_011639 [Semiaphis heraclei]